MRPFIQEENCFAASEHKFYELVGALQSQATTVLQFSGLETFIETEGRELLRLLLQGHVNSRGPGDVGTRVEGADDISRTHKKLGDRQIKSIFGPIELLRMGYGYRNTTSLFPKDMDLNAPENSHSHELQRRVALEVVKGSFENGAESILETTGQSIPKQQVERISVSSAQDFDAFYQAKASEENPEKAESAALVVLTTDGKGIVMHKEDLRPETRKKAETGEKKMENRLSPGEKKNSKRMASVASVYNINRFIRSPEDFKNELASVKPPETAAPPAPRPKPLAKRVWASVEKSQEAVISEIFEEGLRRDQSKGKDKTWVALVDGAPSQIKRIQVEAESRGIQVTIICDIIHVVEYLWKAAWVFFDKGDKEAEAWVSERFLSILQGKSSAVAAAIRRTATKRKLSNSTRKAADTCSDYLLNKAPYLKYNEYLSQGFPIATGIIEGTCRYLVKDRMDITGARWRITGAEAVLKLRSLKASGDFQEYWKFHEIQELIRNHSLKYKNI
jgi:hypothetical protein